MKTIIRIIAAMTLAMGLAWSCDKYDDSAVKADIATNKTDITNLQGRVTSLESLVQAANTDISSLQTIVTSLSSNVFVSGIAETSDGYEITFSDNKKITIRNGKDGADGKDGKDGTDGKDGVDGKDGTDGSTPVIGVKQDEDQIWYWTLDGEWLLGDDGAKIKAEGTDGKDGKNGINGKDGIDGVNPQLKIEDDYWYVSTDEGKTWTKLGKATGEDGVDGDSMFSDVSYDESSVTFTLADGTVLEIGRGANGVQAVAVIPDYSDGSVKANLGDFMLRFDVLPSTAASSVASLSSDNFEIRVVYTATKATAGDKLNLAVKNVAMNGGTLVLTVDGSTLADEYFAGTLGANASLIIDDGLNAVTSGYFQLYYNTARINGYEYVELGDGLKWATMNIGASTETDYGDCFAWGETEPYYESIAGDGTVIWKSGKEAGYDWSSYKFNPSGDGETFTKYNDDSSTTLEAADDAARANWGSTWRMPTIAEWKRLYLVVGWTWTWTDNYKSTGVAGYTITSTVPGYEGNSIFLPAGRGSRIGTDWMNNNPRFGKYWSSSRSEDYVEDAQLLVFYPFQGPTFASYYGYSYLRCYGMPVRPVSD